MPSSEAEILHPHSKSATNQQHEPSNDQEYMKLYSLFTLCLHSVVVSTGCGRLQSCFTHLVTQKGLPQLTLTQVSVCATPPRAWHTYQVMLIPVSPVATSSQPNHVRMPHTPETGTMSCKTRFLLRLLPPPTHTHTHTQRHSALKGCYS